MSPPITLEDLLNKRKVEGYWVNKQKHKIIWLSLGLGCGIGDLSNG